MRRRALAVSLLLIVSAAAAQLAATQAIEFPKLPDFISVAIARVAPTLGPRLDSLKKERADLVEKAADFDKTCGKVAAGTAADLQCAQYFPILSAALRKHVEKSDIFLADYASASTAADVIAPPILRTGALPKAVDDAIAGAYRTSAPEVTDRVRRGFQAVQARDWKLASAWFKDALSREPGNAGLKELATIAEAPPAPAPSKLQLPNDTDVQFLFPGEMPAPAPQRPPPGADDVYYFRPTKGYYRMTLAGARMQQLLDAVKGMPPGSIVTIVNRH